MISFLRRAFVVATLALPATATLAATMPVPPDFGVVERHELIQAHWSLMRGESPSAVDRATIEKVCKLGERSMPIFEDDPGRPDTVEIVHIVAPTAWAGYETMSGVVCDPASMDASKDICGCTFRRMTSRFVHIRKASGAGTEVIDVQLAKASARRSVRKAALRAPDDPPTAASLGAAVGHDIVAGTPCTLYRRDIGISRTELCLSDPTDDTPPALRLQELARTTFLIEDGIPVRREWRRVERIEPNAQIDAGVFDLPAGVTIK